MEPKDALALLDAMRLDCDPPPPIDPERMARLFVEVVSGHPLDELTLTRDGRRQRPEKWYAALVAPATGRALAGAQENRLVGSPARDTAMTPPRSRPSGIGATPRLFSRGELQRSSVIHGTASTRQS